MKNRLIPGAAALVALGLTVGSVIAPTAADARPRDPRVRCGFDNDDPRCEETSGGSKRNEKGDTRSKSPIGKIRPRTSLGRPSSPSSPPLKPTKLFGTRTTKVKAVSSAAITTTATPAVGPANQSRSLFSLMAPTPASIIKTSVMALKSTSTVNSLRCMATVMT